ncbi:MAG: cation diffusion facilitator family transporter [Candidatus Aenigmatarchaeota archaeon]
MGNSDNKAVLKKGQKTVEVAALVSLFLAAIKAAAGAVSGSLVLLSSALDSFVDLIGQAASWVGFRVSQRKPSEKFHYGYYKAESLVTLLVSFFILYAAARLFLEGYERLLVPSGLEVPLIALSVALINIIASFLLSKYFERAGEETSSPLLMACAKERLMDAVSGVAVFLAVITSYFRVPYVEGVVVMILSFLIFKVGLGAVRDSSYVLMDVSPSREVERKLRAIIGKAEGVRSFNELKLRKSGPFIFGEVKIRVKKNVNVYQAHELSESIEREIKEKIPSVDTLTIHLEPCQMGKCRVAIPLRDSNGLDSSAADGLGGAPYILFADIDKDEGKIENYAIEKNPAKDAKVRRGLEVAKFIAEKKADFVLVSEISPVPFHTLSDHLIEIYELRGKTAREVLESFLNDGLEHVLRPNKKME